MVAHGVQRKRQVGIDEMATLKRCKATQGRVCLAAVTVAVLVFWTTGCSGSSGSHSHPPGFNQRHLSIATLEKIGNKNCLFALLATRGKLKEAIASSGGKGATAEDLGRALVHELNFKMTAEEQAAVIKGCVEGVREFQAR
jgi:hypothetical protein